MLEGGRQKARGIQTNKSPGKERKQERGNSMQLMNWINWKLFVAKEWVKEQLEDETGEVNILAIILIVIVVIALVVIFRQQLTTIVNNLFQRITGELGEF